MIKERPEMKRLDMIVSDTTITDAGICVNDVRSNFGRRFRAKSAD